MSDEEMEPWLYEAYRDFVERSMKSQNGWVRKGGPNGHLSHSERSQLANLRAAVHLFLLEHSKPPCEQPDMPF